MINAALSPCPNDTFLFYPWIAGHVGSALPITPFFHDIQALNQFALAKEYPLTKLSIATYAKVQDDYDLLPIGAALGLAQGPKIISKKKIGLQDLTSLTVAIPGIDTTAYLLFKLFAPKGVRLHFCLYHEVIDLLHKGVVDAGVIIHETRFFFAEQGYYEVADLGNLFYDRTGEPVPLGALALSKAHAHEKGLIIDILSASLAFAKAHPAKGLEFILSKSQEKDLSIIQQHIALYVNEETTCLSEKGWQAIHALLAATALAESEEKEPS